MQRRRVLSVFHRFTNFVVPPVGHKRYQLKVASPPFFSINISIPLLKSSASLPNNLIFQNKYTFVHMCGDLGSKFMCKGHKAQIWCDVITANYEHIKGVIFNRNFTSVTASKLQLDS